MKLLIIDNYDSFTYNLYHYACQFCSSVQVLKNDEVKIEYLEYYDKIILSPGPGLPREHNNLFKIIDVSINKPLLGVCLGHQAIAEYFGATLLNLNNVNHGISCEICIKNKDYIFNSIPEKLNVGLYHSWFVDKNNFPDNLIITSENDKGDIYSFRHKKLDIRGFQFHPESIMTEYGLQMIKNWIEN
tara:strand:- start:192 stop:752 length:561 start_codon:yes stop_codon:yes gene_type:complete